MKYYKSLKLIKNYNCKTFKKSSVIQISIIYIIYIYIYHFFVLKYILLTWNYKKCMINIIKLDNFFKYIWIH